LSSTQKKNTFFGAAAILAAGTILVKLIGAVYKIPLGNILSDEAYADFSLAYYVYNIFLTISTAGLPVALSKTISEANALGRENQVRKVFKVALCTFLTLGTLSFIAMSFFGRPLAVAMGNEAAVYCVMALSPSVLCVCVMSAFRGYAQGHLNMVPTTISQIIESLFKLIVGLTLAVLVLNFLPGTETYKQQMAAAGAILGVSIGSVVALVFLLIDFARSHRTPRRSADVPDDSRTILRHLLRIAIPITLGSAAISIVNLADTTIINHLLQQMYTDLPELITPEAVAQAAEPNGIDAVVYMARSLKGIYDKCVTLYNLPASLMVPLTASIIPAVSACLTRRDRRGAHRITESAMRMAALLALPMGAGLCALSGPIVGLLFRGINQDVAGPIMAILGLSSVFVCTMLLCNATLQAHGVINLPVFTVVIGGVVKVAVNYVLVGNYDINIIGAPIGTLCCFAVVAVLDLLIIKRIVPNPPRYGKVFLKPLIASALMGAAAWAFYGLLTNFLHLGPSISTVLSIGAGVVIYLILVLALRIISREDLELMPKGDKIAKILHID